MNFGRRPDCGPRELSVFGADPIDIGRDLVPLEFCASSAEGEVILVQANLPDLLAADPVWAGCLRDVVGDYIAFLSVPACVGDVGDHGCLMFLRRASEGIVVGIKRSVCCRHVHENKAIR